MPIGQLLEAWRILLHASNNCQLRPDKVLAWHKKVLEHMQGNAEQDQPLPELDGEDLPRDEMSEDEEDVQTAPAPGSAGTQTTAKLTADDLQNSHMWEIGDKAHDFSPLRVCRRPFLNRQTKEIRQHKNMEQY